MTKTYSHDEWEKMCSEYINPVARLAEAEALLRRWMKAVDVYAFGTEWPVETDTRRFFEESDD